LHVIIFGLQAGGDLLKRLKHLCKCFIERQSPLPLLMRRLQNKKKSSKASQVHNCTGKN